MLFTLNQLKMIDFHSDLKPEYCKECEEKTVHKRLFNTITRGHTRIATTTCMVCKTSTTVE